MSNDLQIAWCMLLLAERLSPQALHDPLVSHDINQEDTLHFRRLRSVIQEAEFFISEMGRREGFDIREKDEKGNCVHELYQIYHEGLIETTMQKVPFRWLWDTIQKAKIWLMNAARHPEADRLDGQETKRLLLHANALNEENEYLVSIAMRNDKNVRHCDCCGRPMKEGYVMWEDTNVCSTDCAKTMFFRFNKEAKEADFDEWINTPDEGGDTMPDFYETDWVNYVEWMD